MHLLAGIDNYFIFSAVLNCKPSPDTEGSAAGLIDCPREVPLAAQVQGKYSLIIPGGDLQPPPHLRWARCGPYGCAKHRWALGSLLQACWLPGFHRATL